MLWSSKRQFLLTVSLAGLKVVDVARCLTCPCCTSILADLGADVIKVEPGPNGDMIRQLGPFDQNISVYYLSANRNKKGKEVNFRDPEGLALIRRMSAQVDIVVENFKVGTIAAVGLGY